MHLILAPTIRLLPLLRLQLITRQRDVLYSLFELAAMKHSRLILIGVANALDLTERELPSLDAKKARSPDMGPNSRPLAGVFLNPLAGEEPGRANRRAALTRLHGESLDPRAVAPLW